MRLRDRPLDIIASGLLLAILAGGVWGQETTPGKERPGRERPQDGSRLGGYEKPPPANDVPDHLYDIILGRPTDRSVTARVLSYEDIEGRIVFAGPGDHDSRSTDVVRLKQGEPVDFVLNALSPDTRFHYRFQHRKDKSAPFAQSDEHTFHTARTPGSAFLFTVQSDSHLDENTSPSVYERTLANARANGPDFHLELGDTFMTDKYVRPELAHGQYLTQRYYFGRLCHSAPLFFALGNHDGETGDRGSNLWATRTRTKFFPNPEPNQFYSGNATSDPSLGLIANWYAWRWGDAQFIVLDPFRHTTTRSRGRDDVDAVNWNRTLGRAQYDWLRLTLEKSDAPFKFVFLHHLVGGADRNGRGGIEAAPYFEWGGKSLDGTDEFDRRRPGWGLPIHDLLVKHHVSIVFHGHDHLFVKQDLDGIVYQEVPQPGHPRFGNIRSAADYGYKSGPIQSSSGHLRVHVARDTVRVDYVRAYLPDQETPQRMNGEISFSYLVRPGGSKAATR